MCRFDPHTTEYRELSRNPGLMLEGVRPHGSHRSSDPTTVRGWIRSEFNAYTGWLARDNNVYKLCAALFLLAAVLANAEPQVIHSISSAIKG